MSDYTRTEVDYETEVVAARRLCDTEPVRVDVFLFKTVTTTTRHDDGSVTEHTTPRRRVASWTYAAPVDPVTQEGEGE